MNQETYVAYNFNSRIETEGYLNVTGSHVSYKSANILETVRNIYTDY